MHRCRSAPFRAGDKGAGEGVSRARLPSVERLLDVLEPNPRPRGPARRCPQVCWVGAQADGEGLTLVSPRAYRWPVTRCRLVPHVHAEPRTRGACVVGGRCQPKGDTDRASAHGHNLRRRRGDPLVLAGSTLHRRPAKENISRVRLKYVEVGRSASTKFDLMRRALEDGLVSADAFAAGASGQK